MGGYWLWITQFDGYTEVEVIEIVMDNILKKWPDAVLNMTTHWNHNAIGVARDGAFHYIEPEIPPGLHYIAIGF